MTLLEWLAQSGVERQALAARLGKSPSLVSHWLRGDRTPLVADVIAIEKITDGAVRPADWINIEMRPPKWRRPDLKRKRKIRRRKD
jgi:DNA-binding transcriptional regulator YdaS (Cro superfamily)